jgi:hypothetical protein
VSLPVLRTDRLRLEPVGDADAGHLEALNADREAMRFILGRPRTQWQGEVLYELKRSAYDLSNAGPSSSPRDTRHVP